MARVDFKSMSNEELLKYLKDYNRKLNGSSVRYLSQQSLQRLINLRDNCKEEILKRMNN